MVLVDLLRIFLWILYFDKHSPLFPRIQKQMRLLVASQDGYLYVYSLDMNEGGDCTLLKQHRLVFIMNAVTKGLVCVSFS